MSGLGARPAEGQPIVVSGDSRTGTPQAGTSRTYTLPLHNGPPLYDEPTNGSGPFQVSEPEPAVVSGPGPTLSNGPAPTLVNEQGSTLVNGPGWHGIAALLNAMGYQDPAALVSGMSYYEAAVLVNAMAFRASTAPAYVDGPADERPDPPRADPRATADFDTALGEVTRGTILPQDLVVWHQCYRRCQIYFLDIAQHHPSCKAVAACINIALPCQWKHKPLLSSINNSAPAEDGSSTPPTEVSLFPYVRRLVCTGFAQPGLMRCMFGPDYVDGIVPVWELERRNYLFTIKSTSWANMKARYDMPDGQTVSRLLPLEDTNERELWEAQADYDKWCEGMHWVGPQAMDEGFPMPPGYRYGP